MKKIIIFLILLLILAYFLRTLYLKDLALNFYYDQARDAYTVGEILGGNIKILGPSANAPGLYHGVFYYYVVALGYWFGQGNPISAAYFLSLVNCLAVIIVFLFGYSLTKKVGVGLLAAFFLAISYEANQYAVWLSNPVLALVTIPHLYLCLWLWLNGSNQRGYYLYPVLTGLSLGLSIQADIFLVYHLPVVLCWLILTRVKVTKKSLVCFLSALFVASLSLIICEIKFGFRGFNGFLYLINNSDAIISSKGFGDVVVLYLNQIGAMFSRNLLPLNVGYGGALGFILIFWLIRSGIKQKNRGLIKWQFYLASIIVSHITVVSIGGSSTPYLTVGLGVITCLIAAIFISEIFTKAKYLAIGLIIIITASNVISIVRNNKGGQTLFAIQNDMTLRNETAAIDYIYRDANGETFSIETLTNPLWINTTWSYLFNWYGLNKYRYLPAWDGNDQIGQPGNNLGKRQPNSHLKYYIIEPPLGIPAVFYQNEQQDESYRSTFIEERNFGQIRVQKRLIKD